MNARKTSSSVGHSFVPTHRNRLVRRNGYRHATVMIPKATPRTLMHWLGPAVIALLAAGALSAAPGPSRPHKPMRIVSLNLCADQYLLALADRDQIAALTQFARDPAMSAAAAQAARLPVSRGSAEDVLALAPDLIIAAPGGRADMRAALVGRNYPTIELPPANNYAEILAQIREVAAAIGQVGRGEALIARMNADLAALPRPRPHGIAAYYQRRGYMTGTGTLVDELMRRAGLDNLATKLRKPVLSQLSLEEMIAARPDWLIVEDATARVTDQGTEMLHHPVLRDIRRLHLPQAWTVCGGPAYVQAARSLTAQIAAVRR